MPSTSTQDWFYSVPSKRSEAPAKDAPAPSQIPGLSNLPDDPSMENDRTARRKWIRDTDSKYIKLAKAGGRRDLLKYRDPPEVSSEAVPYPRVDWFDHQAPGNDDETDANKDVDCRVLPEWYVHDVEHVAEPEGLRRIPSKVAGLPSKRGPEEKSRNPISFDKMSCWEREKREDQKLPSIRRSKGKLSKSQSQLSVPQQSQAQVPLNSVRLPQIQEQVDFSKLMSNHYQREWHEEQKKEREKSRVKRKEEESEKRAKMEILSQPRKGLRATGVQEEKPLFKMSRFANVPARVQVS